MHSTIVTESVATKKKRGAVHHKIRKILFRKLWLPRPLYEALPVIYILMGLVALVSGLYLPDGTWILPYAVLLGLVCLHAGLGVAALRYRHSHRRNRRPDPKQ